MFAGGRVDFHAQLHVGDRVRREDELVRIESKSGRHGEFLLVESRTRLYGERGDLAVDERRDLVYRDATDSNASPAAAVLPASSSSAPRLLAKVDGQWLFRTDSVMLMRFSSATSNGHRIHFDWPYATQVEGYPGLVVHGPLMTLALVEVLRLEGSTSGVRSVIHRNTRPLFCGEAAEVRHEDPSRAAAGDVTLRRGGEVHSSLSMRF
ncbi:hypothetical protein EV643_103353 [Kribbella sp. VKM Ac-2527]|uniref:Uncharacterized protein n=2 Tax=Kribbella caucasensis TaxID=2512215 RepID=A0A4R6KJX0_9ACTN|nr:hypothetical protein EV643_103353 [Kribbella sp. VKM Ac-2527]